jgi:HAE1 family hydrophobic/amphiphilic exporter-1
MVMASQFESLTHPFVIMFTIPLGFIGVIVGLLIGGQNVSLPAIMGFIMLAGIAVNNGIVMVDFINQLRRRGMEVFEAIVQAATIRLRPVIITATTTILAMMPMVFTASEGAEMRRPMAMTLVGGLVATTLLTLIFIPVMYSILDRVAARTQKAVVSTLHSGETPEAVEEP